MGLIIKQNMVAVVSVEEVTLYLYHIFYRKSLQPLDTWLSNGGFLVLSVCSKIRLA